MGPTQPVARVRALNPGVALAEPWRLRVMSYNILADQYAGTAYAQQVCVCVGVRAWFALSLSVQEFTCSEWSHNGTRHESNAAGQ